MWAAWIDLAVFISGSFRAAHIMSDVSAACWQGVIQALHNDPRALLALLQTCKALHELADHEHTWQSVAAACWRHLAAVERAGYRTHKALVLDDNRANAALALAFNNTACTYRFQQPHAFYECRLVQLQWWRAQNSLRLYFDARGEGDLRLPMESSIAVIKLKDGSAATAAAEACSCSCSSDLAAGPTPAGRVCSGSFDLDAMGTRLLVLAPDACQTFIQKPGHYKGVFIWRSAKTSELLKALLLRQPADTEGPPAQQHSPVSAGRRSEAWEEWADWLLQQPQEQEAPAAASSSGIPRTSGLTSPVSNLLRSCFTQWCSSSAGSSSSASSAAHAGQQQDPAPAAALSGKVQNGSRTATSSCGQQQQEEEEGQEESCRHSDVARHALVFCYANDLRWYYTTRTPDYSITPLAVALPVPAKPNSSAAVISSGRAVGRACPSPQGRPYQQRGQVTKHLQPKSSDVALSKPEEGQLAAAWKALPGACAQQCNALDQQLQAEGEVEEQLRFAGLPAAVKARGRGWWV